MRSIPPPAAVLFEPGFRFDGYELLVKIGQGGMASVWLARTKNDHDHEVLVAIKTILPEFAAHDEFKTMMLDESRIVTALHSPNVAAMLKVGEVWGIPYLVLEYVAGESLDHLAEALKGEAATVPPSIVTRLLIDTCAGLTAAHDLRSQTGEPLDLVHRDLSPQNVLVDERGHVKLIDFGIAKAQERVTPETAEGVMKGKIPFMAPEHAMGGDVDRRSDLWSLGAVAYLLLTGKEPYEGPNDAARLIRKLSREPLPPIPSVVPEALTNVIVKVLSHSPDNRFPTAEAFAEALAAAVPPASHTEVAEYFHEKLNDTIRARQMLVERSVAAANARARARDMLSNPEFPSYSGELSFAPKGARDADPSPSPETTLSLPPPTEPQQRPWPVYVGAAAIALAVVLAYSIGASTHQDRDHDRPSPTGREGSGPTTRFAESATTAPIANVLPSVAPSFASSAAASASASTSTSVALGQLPPPTKPLPAAPVPSTAPATSVAPTTSPSAAKRPPEETIF